MNSLTYPVVITTIALFTSAALIAIKAFHSTPKVYIYGNLDLNSLSEPLRTDIAALKQQMPEVFALQWLIIRKGPNSVEYATTARPPEILRVASIANSLSRLRFLRKAELAEGEYIISLSDGIAFASAWPIMAFSSTSELVANNKVVLMPDFEASKGYPGLLRIVDAGLKKFPWSQKINKIYFRGSATGSDLRTADINTIPRIQFMNLSKGLSFVDAGLTSYSAHQWNAKALAKLRQNFALVKPTSPADSLAFKYLLDIDGNACTFSRKAWILYSNSLLMKPASNKIQWYSHKLLPYVHYLPLNQDFSNLQQQYTWAESHQAEVIAITRNANALAAEVFSEEAVDSATLGAFAKYNKLMAQEKGLR